MQYRAVMRQRYLASKGVESLLRDNNGKRLSDNNNLLTQKVQSKTVQNTVSNTVH